MDLAPDQTQKDLYFAVTFAVFFNLCSDILDPKQSFTVFAYL